MCLMDCVKWAIAPRSTEEAAVTNDTGALATTADPGPNVANPTASAEAADSLMVEDAFRVGDRRINILFVGRLIIVVAIAESRLRIVLCSC